jgi:hypothetical protein
MDPISALSLAACVVQFVSFTGNVVSKGKLIYDIGDGSLVGNIDFQVIATRLESLTGKLRDGLKDTPGCLTEDEQQLESVCEDCIAISAKLIRRLERLNDKQQCKGEAWKSIRQALKSVWSKKEIDEIVKRLDLFRGDLDTNILVSMR